MRTLHDDHGHRSRWVRVRVFGHEGSSPALRPGRVGPHPRPAPSSPPADPSLLEKDAPVVDDAPVTPVESECPPITRDMVNGLPRYPDGLGARPASVLVPLPQGHRS